MDTEKIFSYLKKHKYEFLLFGLIQHLFAGIFLSDMIFYRNIICPLNMLILGIASFGIFTEKELWKRRIKNILLLFVLVLPIFLPIFEYVPQYLILLSIVYVIYFLFIFWELLLFLVKPGYINVDIISACACGYLLIIEISTFLMQVIFYNTPEAFKGIISRSNSEIFIDFVYFSSITITSIGFGDIIPNNHHTKLLIAFFGISGQFYSVVLVGILISKFSSTSQN